MPAEYAESECHPAHGDASTGKRYEAMDTATATVASPSAIRAKLRKSPFFSLLGLAMLIMAVAGFWPQYFSALTGRAPAPSAQFWLIHVHAALFTGWLILYTSQAALVMMGRTRVHLRLGPWLTAYGVAIAAVGIYAALLLAHQFGVRQNDFDAAAEFVFFPLIDMLYFAGFLAAAVVWRRRPDLHKRAMLVATFSIAVVGVGRLVGRLPFESAFIWQPLNLLPLLAAIAYDLWAGRRMYTVLIVGLALHLVRLNAELFTTTEAWLPIGRALIAPFR